MNELVKKHGLKYGSIFGIIAVVYTIGVYAIDESIFAKWWINLAFTTLGIVLFIIASAKVKKDQGGYISFRDAFSAFMLAVIVYLAIATAGNILLFHVIDTGLGDRVQEIIMENTIGFMERIGADDAAIEEAIEKQEAEDMFAIGQQIKGALYFIIFLAVIGAISSAIIKKQKEDHHG